MKFSDKVYKLCSKIPRGKVSTYKEIGNALNIAAYQAIGGALKNNPNAPIVPCHRVVSANGSIGGFHGHTTGKFITKKINLLKKEGVLVKNNEIVDFKKKLHKF